MIIGQAKRWWNRHIPRGILIALVMATGLLWFWVLYGGVCSALAWDIAHGRTAEFRGQSLKVPWFWKETTQINYNQLEIGRYGADPLQPSVTITFENSNPAALEDRLNQAKESLSTKANIAVEDFHFDDMLDSNFRCIDFKLFTNKVSLVDCYSRDGVWRVSMVDPSPYKLELAEILRGVSSMGVPVK